MIAEEPYDMTEPHGNSAALDIVSLYYIDSHSHRNDFSKNTKTACENSPNFDQTFTGKERDEETGYSYFGARYYDSDLSGLFLGIDPMAYKYPGLSPYAYCAWNPLKLVDPDGSDTINVNLDKGTINRIQTDGDHSIRYFKNGEIAGEDQIKKDKCSFRTNKYDISLKDNEKVAKCHNEHLYVSDIDIGESIFKKIATLGSYVEWDYYSMDKGYGDLSSSGLEDKMIHVENIYTANTVQYWDHYHPATSSDSFYPSYADQDHARDLRGARCTIFSGGLSMDFNNYVPSHENGYINISNFRQLWNRFAR